MMTELDRQLAALNRLIRESNRLGSELHPEIVEFANYLAKNRAAGSLMCLDQNTFHRVIDAQTALNVEKESDVSVPTAEGLADKLPYVADFAYQESLFNDVMQEAANLGTDINSFTKQVWKNFQERIASGNKEPLSTTAFSAIIYQRAMNEKRRHAVAAESDKADVMSAEAYMLVYDALMKHLGKQQNCYECDGGKQAIWNAMREVYDGFSPETQQEVALLVGRRVLTV